MGLQLQNRPTTLCFRPRNCITLERVGFGFLRSTRFHNQASSRSIANSDCKFTISLENGNDLCVQYNFYK